MAIRSSTSDPEIMRNRIGRGQPSYRFPDDIASKPAFFSINMREYKSLVGKVDEARGFSSKGSTKSIDTPASIGGAYFHLPLPGRGLHDEFSIEYGSMEMGALGATGQTIMDMINDPSQIVGNAVTGTVSLGSKLLQAGVGSIGDVVGVGNQAAASIELAQGFVSNPNIAVLFKGVDIRNHTFTWKMIAKNPKEAIKIQRICTMLKYYALPARSLGANFALDYPHIAFLYLVGPKNNGLITFSEKGSFIKGVDVGYNGQDSITFFKSLGLDDFDLQLLNYRPADLVRSTSNSTNALRGGGNFLAPVEVDLTLGFVERAIVTRDDIETGDIT